MPFGTLVMYQKTTIFALKLFYFGSVGSEISTVKVDVFKNYVAPTKLFKEPMNYHAVGLFFFVLINNNFQEKKDSKNLPLTYFNFNFSDF